MWRYLFSYVPTGLPPEVPKEEPPDPNGDRELSDAYRGARRSLVAVCAVSIAWATAQFSIEELTIDGAGVTLDLKNAAVPIMLGLGVAYLTCRWVLEFAMMPRFVRRWRLAQLDFRVVSVLARFALLAVAAGAMDRSLHSVAIVVALIVALVLTSGLLIVVLTFAVMPIRIWARNRANAPSAANAAFESLSWATLFSLVLSAVGILFLGVASYKHEPLRLAVWPTPPSPIALSVFVGVLTASFLSHWLLRPAMNRLFAVRPPYYTERASDGGLVMHSVHHEKEPLL